MPASRQEERHMDQLRFETVPAELMAGLGTGDKTILRARVVGGWIVLYDDAKRIKFLPCTPAAPNAAPSDSLPTRTALASTFR
jgi:hypothetical protein